MLLDFCRNHNLLLCLLEFLKDRLNLLVLCKEIYSYRFLILFCSRPSNFPKSIQIYKDEDLVQYIIYKASKGLYVSEIITMIFRSLQFNYKFSMLAIQSYIIPIFKYRENEFYIQLFQELQKSDFYISFFENLDLLFDVSIMRYILQDRNLFYLFMKYTREKYILLESFVRCNRQLHLLILFSMLNFYPFLCTEIMQNNKYLFENMTAYIFQKIKKIKNPVDVETTYLFQIFFLNSDVFHTSALLAYYLLSQWENISLNPQLLSILIVKYDLDRILLTLKTEKNKALTNVIEIIEFFKK